jgi:hypothetical protein
VKSVVFTVTKIEVVSYAHRQWDDDSKIIRRSSFSKLHQTLTNHLPVNTHLTLHKLKPFDAPWPPIQNPLQLLEKLCTLVLKIA